MEKNREIIQLTESHRGGPKSTAFTGRPEGKEVRIKLQLNERDGDDKMYVVVLPANTSSFNSSFFLGLFFDSIRRLGGVEAFKNKYQLSLDKLSDGLKFVIQKNLDECFRKASNEFDNKTGLD